MKVSTAQVWSNALRGFSEAIQRQLEEDIEARRQIELMRRRVEHEMELDRQRAEAMRRQVESERAEAEAQRARQAQLSQIEARKLGVTGSGFFVTDRGHVITNAHVVGDFKAVLVRDINSQFYHARIVRIDLQRDLALLVVDKVSKGLSIQKSTADLKGEDVFAVGYPMPGVQGQESKITNGIVSSLSGLEGDAALMQISAAIQGGNSGGPLVSTNGNVVGVVVSTINAKQILESSGRLAQNINYAVKSERLLEFLNDCGLEPNGRPVQGKALKAVDESTVMVLSRDMPFSISASPIPESNRTKTAAMQEKSDFESLGAASNAVELRRFLSLYPRGRYESDVKKQLLALDRVDWREAASENSANFHDSRASHP
jgi:S1-C subfamily serine protease